MGEVDEREQRLQNVYNKPLFLLALFLNVFPETDVLCPTEDIFCPTTQHVHTIPSIRNNKKKYQKRKRRQTIDKP